MQSAAAVSLKLAVKIRRIISMVPKSEHSMAVYKEVLPALDDTKLCIDMSTIDPSVSVEISEMVKKTGAEFVDAPVVKSKPAAIAGKLGIYVGGDEKACEKAMPILSYMGSDIALEKLIYASLFTFDSEGSLKPYLAESYTVSEDQKTIDFKIRQGVKWQDGEDFTMDDLIFTIESAAKSVEDFEKVAYVKGAAEYKDGQADSISGVSVPEENVLRLELTEPYAPFMADFGTYGIIPKHVWSEIPQEEWEKQTELLNSR